MSHLKNCEIVRLGGGLGGRYGSSAEGATFANSHAPGVAASAVSTQHDWAVILAAGDGTRLAGLTRDMNGVVIPKQFCSLDGGFSLLAGALARAARVVPHARICAVVAAKHSPYWIRDLADIPRSHIIVQPENRGTAHGVLLAALCIQRLDPRARIGFFPADHHVADEPALADGLLQVVPRGYGDRATITLVGIEPDEADPELGYIVADETGSHGYFPVRRSVEKPSKAEAEELIAAGALWNSFIFAADVAPLLHLLGQHLSHASRMCGAVESGGAALVDLYREIPSIDFSRSIMQDNEMHLRVVRTPRCGWSDLGTPARVARTIRQLEHVGPVRPPAEAHHTVSLLARLRLTAL
jgi:mannose-1-phosphate guanylyltransferase